jgi:photosystem II stability/assembly factor-like uncharacterized protein
MTRYFLYALLFTVSFSTVLTAQKHKKDTNEKDLIAETANGLSFRSIGPAFSSGRIADFAVNPDNPNEFYVAAASGHIWKTNNNGLTFKPVFDKHGVYSIGCLAMDPNNHNIIWAGTGENNHQRAIGYGNGVYKSTDGGKSWKNTGLINSRQIGMINIDPRDSNTVLVAAEGAIWGPGGERGLYKTTDGGKSWKKVINISENTGVNNIIRDPENPDIMYATSEQRRRHVFTHISGGPESAVYKSEDGGNTWRKIMKGLPKTDIGGMGIAVSPVNPNVVYLIMEAAEGKSGFFRSTDKGESWEKMSNYHSSGQYYNEIYCDPLNVNKVYSPQTYSKFTTDGGKTWKDLGLKNKHVDDHAMWINPNNPQHFLIGGDGGAYITYDGGKHYRHFDNLPIVQFYRVYIDNAYPFYNVYGGTQDNNSYGGPSRSINADGVSACDWTITVGGDGFWGAVDPENPNIIYSEYQYGNIFRYDKKSGQRIKIKPQPGKDELTYKWNWNTPFIISPHNHKRLYIAANKLFKSDDRGNSWEVISPDLTAQIDRNTWQVMGKYWSIDAVRKDVSTSLFGTIVSLDESPVQEGLLYTGSDDGVIQVSEDGGKNWRKITHFPGVPPYTYVSDIFADRFDANTVYATFNNLKRDDFKPYILKSTDKGQTWKNISGNLPENGSVHTISQDFVQPGLLFAGTEFGIYFSINGGKKWYQLKSGIPDIAIRDIAIQQRENDLVLASFGRGFYILDDYSPLRKLNDDFVNQEAYLFPVKDALQYVQTHKKYGQGEVFYAKNPPYGAIFTYYLKETPLSSTEKRHQKEKKLFKKGEKIPQPSLKDLEDEKKEEPSYLLFSIYNSEGNIIKKITSKPQKGLHRISWNLKYENTYPVDNELKEFNPFKKHNFGFPVLPGTYYVKMGLFDKGIYRDLSEKIPFNVKRLQNTTFNPLSDKEFVSYFDDLQQTVKRMEFTQNSLMEIKKRLIISKQTVLKSPETGLNLMTDTQKAEKELNELFYVMYGIEPKASYEEIPPHHLPINKRFSELIWVHLNSTDPITQTEKEQLIIVKQQLSDFIVKMKKFIKEKLVPIEQKIEKSDTGWTPGRIPNE